LLSSGSFEKKRLGIRWVSFFSPFFPSFEDSEAAALSRESLRSVAFEQKNGHDDKPFITLYDEKLGAGASPNIQISS